MTPTVQAEYDMIIRGCAAHHWRGKTERERDAWYVSQVDALAARCTNEDDKVALNDAKWQNIEGSDNIDPEQIIE